MKNRYIESVEYPGYAFTKTGEFWDLKNNKRIFPDGGLFRIMVDDKIIYINALHYFIREYYGGIIEVPVNFIDGNSMNYSSKNISLQISDNERILLNSPYTKIIKIGGLLFKRINDFPKYFISENGIIYGVVRQQFIVLNTDKDGYKFVKLFDSNNHRVMKRISRLVYETFIGEIPNEYMIDHYDGIVNHNNVENLNAIAPADNNLKGHTFDMRRKLFNDSLVELICKNIEDGKSVEEIFALDIIEKTFSTLESFTNFCTGLMRGLYYRNITSKYDLRNYHHSSTMKRRYTASQVHDICKMLEKGYPKIEISRILKIPVSIIKNIYGRYSWKDISLNYKF